MEFLSSAVDLSRTTRVGGKVDLSAVYTASGSCDGAVPLRKVNREPVYSGTMSMEPSWSALM